MSFLLRRVSSFPDKSWGLHALVTAIAYAILPGRWQSWIFRWCGLSLEELVFVRWSFKVGSEDALVASRPLHGILSFKFRLPRYSSV